MRSLWAVSAIGVLVLTGCSEGEVQTAEPASSEQPEEGAEGSGGGTASDGAGDDDASETADADHEASDPGEGDDSETSEDAGSGEVIRVSDDAVFVSPSENIACEVRVGDGGRAACDIIDSEFDIEIDPADVPEHGTTACEEPGTEPRHVILQDGEITWRCSHEPLMFGADVAYGGSWGLDGTTTEIGGQTLAVLDYGRTLRGDGYECTSEAEGITCQQIDGGHGFTLSRAGFGNW